MSMEGIQSIMERLQARCPGLNVKPMSARDRAEASAESYNSSIGDRDLVDGYNCDICHNKGFLAVVRKREDMQGDDMFEELVVPCQCDKIRRSLMRMKRSGLGPLLEKYRFENYVVEEPWQQVMKDKAMSFAKNPESMFFVGGQSGSGKTHLCTAIARDLLFSGSELRYVLWRDESVKLKSVINKDDEYQAVISELKQVDVLYIDDFLKVPIGQDECSPTSADLSLALEIINNRYNARLVTIISSEWSVNEILGFDEALGGRIFEMGGAEYCTSLKRDRNRDYRIKNIKEI